MFYKFSLNDSFLVIENTFLSEKIDINSIDDIVISNEFPAKKYSLYMFFTKPIQYEPKKGWLNKMIFLISNNNSNPYEIKRTYYDHEIEPLLILIKKGVPDADLPELKNSLFWRTDDGTNVFSKMKVMYSREKRSLTDIFKKHGMMME
ncbi:hypothetical protein [Chryseobacterium sp. BIGb0232]|uniref:hypothetical protein n=1 Tax=Chryseobacterium sp. BIGb0232 TaxID=2940598 RepID=UPI000F4642BE|nr:hypothetical protein [Chryseobacterium sp. BIGb0232]MCS4302179.1 hypothetical protein [Chryseobacterium sp. BIGb0232]ROS18124.1 hypothetical protein EDF65_2515 [Chryseobacterium nakagawai]